MQHYADRLDAGIKVERPIALGVWKIKAKMGELMPAEKGGRGKKKPVTKGFGFSGKAVSAYRKLAANRGRLAEYYEAIDDVPSQTDFIRYCGSDGNIKANQNQGVVEWYTPAQYIEAARKAMGTVDLDPASSAFAQKTVGAATYYTAADDGLAKDWAGTVWLNPPFKMPEVALFIAKLCESVSSGAVSQAIIVTNNNTDAKWWHAAAETASAICFTRGRIKWYNAAQPDCSPTNGQTFFYFGRRAKTFAKVFAEFGFVVML
jgi:ParB family chromosome partitioning protein